MMIGRNVRGEVGRVSPLRAAGCKPCPARRGLTRPAEVIRDSDSFTSNPIRRKRIGRGARCGLVEELVFGFFFEGSIIVG